MSKNISEMSKTNRLDNRGGKRENSGAKLKYSEHTKTIAFRVPVSQIDELKSIIKNYLQQFKTKKDDRNI